jgi:hypothetical protein
MIVRFKVEQFHCRVFDRSVHPLDLAVSPWVVGLGQSVLYAVGFTNHVEARRSRMDGVEVPGLLGEMNAIVGQDCMDVIGRGFEHVLQELPGSHSVSLCNELSDGELGRSVNSYKEIEPALSSLHLGNIDVEEADGVVLDLLMNRFVVLNIRQARDAVPLNTAMQRGTCRV